MYNTGQALAEHSILAMYNRHAGMHEILSGLSGMLNVPFGEGTMTNKN